VTDELTNEAILNRKGQRSYIEETSAAINRDSTSELIGTYKASGTAYAGTTVQGPAAKADTKTGFNLETLTFTKPGTYKFTIQETPGTETGIRYDTSTWTATVVVTKDMTATVTYTDSQGNTSTQADFVNRVTTTTTTPVKPKEPEETKKPTEPDEPTTVDDNPEDDKPQEPEVSEGPTQPEEPEVSEGPTQPEGPTVTEGPGDSLEDENTGTGLEQPQEDQTTENAPETSVKPTETAPETSAQAQTAASTSLPQTGQDWWPLLLLAAVGVLLIAAGVFHGKKRNI
jgi:pilin isopeptide linkage protein/LPXTG-motif cell wall-anchored protein